MFLYQKVDCPVIYSYIYIAIGVKQKIMIICFYHHFVNKKWHLVEYNLFTLKIIWGKKVFVAACQNKKCLLIGKEWQYAFEQYLGITFQQFCCH